MAYLLKICDELPKTHATVITSFFELCLQATQQIFINIPLSLNNMSNYLHLVTTALSYIKSSYRTGVITDSLFCSIYTSFVNYAESMGANLRTVVGNTSQASAIRTSLNNLPSPFPMTVANVTTYTRMISMAYFGR